MIEYHSYPWHYAVINDFLPWELFTGLIKTSKSLDTLGEVSWDGALRFTYEEGMQSEVDTSVLREAREYMINSEQLKEVYSLLGAGRVEEPEHLTAIQNQPPGFEYHVHAEVRMKAMSVVVYLSPEESIGTELFKTRDGKCVKEVEWEPNRAFIFCGQPDVTWHSFRAGNETRRTFCHFFIDPSKGV